MRRLGLTFLKTLSVISVGDRIMNKGCSYIWEVGCNPYLNTPEEKVTTFEVIRDIPSLRKKLSSVSRVMLLRGILDSTLYHRVRVLLLTITSMERNLSKVAMETLRQLRF